MVAKPENWPHSFIDDSQPRSRWPYLVLTSPFAAKCAIEVSKQNKDLKRIQWLAIGEGTARACFLRGVTVSICAKARDSAELIHYIKENIDRNTKLMIPRSNVAKETLASSLQEHGFDVESWVGYENKTKLSQGLMLSLKMFYSYLHHHLPVHGPRTRYQYLEVYCAWGKHH